MEEVKNSLTKLADAFNKGNVYAALKDLKAGNIQLDDLMEVCEPQRGGGSQSNPSYEENGVMMHWCRLSQSYITEDETQMTLGKSKGVGKLASAIAYRIEKKSKEIAAEALAMFVKGEYAKGGELNAESARILAMIDDPANFTPEAMAISEFNPDAGKNKKVATPVVDDEIL